MEPVPFFQHQSEPAATSETAGPATGRAAAKKAWPTISVHPAQFWALRYVAFMRASTGEPESLEQLAAEAFAYFLHRAQRQGIEFPAKKLAELLDLLLLKK